MDKFYLDEDKRFSLKEFERTAEAREEYCGYVDLEDLHSELKNTIRRLYMTGFDTYQIRGMIQDLVEESLYDVADFKHDQYYDVNKRTLEEEENKEATTAVSCVPEEGHSKETNIHNLVKETIKNLNILKEMMIDNDVEDDNHRNKEE